MIELDKNGLLGSKLGVMPVLTIVFIILKLVGTINWSWWWVLSPLWIGAAIAVLFLLTTLIATGLAYRR